MIAVALLAALLVQDTNTAISPRVRAMLDRFPPPQAGQPGIAIRFSRDTVFVGEQAELVTVTWFPRPLRDRLRRLPGITSPALSGLWSARNQQLPVPVGSRIVGGQQYDMYVSWQTIFPLAAGRIESPPAVLTYNLPTSTSYFAPEVRKTVESATALLIVRPIPAAAAGALGPGPTAQDLRVAWRSPLVALHAGSPAIIELVISGQGNLTLWPAPQINWPASVRVYPEPTDERPVTVGGMIGGEKRFRFTVVSDRAGVLTLPAVQYPFFDPDSRQVQVAVAVPLSLPTLPRTTDAVDRGTLTVTGDTDVPLAAAIVRGWWPVLVALAACPLLLAGWRRRRRRTPSAATATGADPEAALRAALGTPVEAGADHVVAALRVRGVPRDEAEHIHRWLSAVARWRYGPRVRTEMPPPPAEVARVVERLRHGTALPFLLLLLLVIAPPLGAQRDDAVARYNDRDYAGAARAFAVTTIANPDAADAWRDLGSARWMQHDDVAAAAAWLAALALAPRDELLAEAWRAADIPADVRALAPTIPVSRDEMVLGAIACWLLAWIAAARQRALAWTAGTAAAALIAWAGVRWQDGRPGRALVTVSTTVHISPEQATPSVGELAEWARVRIERRRGAWMLVSGPPSGPGSVGAATVRGWVPAASVAAIGRLD